MAIWANIRGEWEIHPYPSVLQHKDPLSIHQVYLWIGLVSGLLAFMTFGGNRFTLLNTALWLSAIAFTVLAFWLPIPERTSWWSKLREKFTGRGLEIRISRWTLFLLIAAAVAIFFRFYRLWEVPPEMVSDHAEKILDIWDVTQGEMSIFFPRNTGREAFQMYLTALVIKLFGTGFTFDSLKIGTALSGLVTLPFIYLLGKEIANKRVGLFALLFAGIAYWPNVISRVALRFTIYPLFVAPTLFFLIRGIRRSNRNDFILAGLTLGLGLHGYTPFRIVPIVIVVAVGLYLLHSQSKGYRKQTLIHLALLALIALIVFLPLLRFWIENPVNFGYRAFTRFGTLESPLPGPGWQIFLNNLWNAVVMFFWSNGETWPVSIPYRPALGIVSAALFFLAVVLMFFRYVRQRNWLDLFLILSVPMLMLPSILSLAFPSENPTLNRTAGALVPVFILVGLSMDGVLGSVEKNLVSLIGRRVAWVVGAVLLVWSAYQNYDLVFNQYQDNYARSSWNTSEIGQVIRDYTLTIGSPESAYVVAYPHWVDTRLVGINAGYPTRDFAIWEEDFPRTLEIEGPKLFILKLDDSQSLSTLQSLYPQGHLRLFESQVSNKDFYEYYVLPVSAGES
jgi:4-amino-4-deoxy-L-arabinose transferase-like glycosyltransferase